MRSHDQQNAVGCEAGTRNGSACQKADGAVGSSEMVLQITVIVIGVPKRYSSKPASYSKKAFIV